MVNVIRYTYALKWATYINFPISEGQEMIIVNHQLKSIME